MEKKKKIDIDAMLNQADKDSSEKTFHGADAKAEKLIAAEKKLKKEEDGRGRPEVPEAEKAKPFVLYLTPGELKSLDRVSTQKSTKKWAKSILLDLAEVLEAGGQNKLLLMGILSEMKK
jgi:hypothetical protein